MAAILGALGNDVTGFDHEAVFYDGEESFLAEMVPYVREGIDAGEAVLVAVSKRKIGLMREQLGPAADGVEFADMATVGPTRHGSSPSGASSSTGTWQAAPAAGESASRSGTGGARRRSSSASTTSAS